MYNCTYIIYFRKKRGNVARDMIAMNYYDIPKIKGKIKKNRVIPIESYQNRERNTCNYYY